MKISKAAKQLAEDLDLSLVDAAMMELKSKMYEECSASIVASDLTHEQIAKLVGTSRARITRISNLGETNVSLELLIKIVATLKNKMPVNISKIV